MYGNNLDDNSTFFSVILWYNPWA